MARAKSEHELVVWLLVGWRLEVHRVYGYASFREYAEWVFGFSARATEERVRLGEALEHLPRLDAAFAAGEVVYSIVREVSRVATPVTEEEWLAAVRDRKASEVERMVSGREKGDRPSDPVKPEAERHRVSLNVDGATWGLWLQARDVATRRSGGTHLSDEDFVRVLVGEYLTHVGASTEALAAEVAGAAPVVALPDGRAPYQVALTICEHCKSATQEAGGRSIVVDEVTVEMAECDAEHIGRVDRASYDRASQTIPPRVRRAVARRHENRCAAPGCRNTRCHVHHTDPRCEGGSHDPEKLIYLCEAHHRAVHDGRLVIRGTWSSGFAFEHADGAGYGSPKTDWTQSKMLADLFDALSALGFRQTEARTMIDAARPHLGADAKMEDALRVALRQARVPGVREERALYRPVHRLDDAPSWEARSPTPRWGSAMFPAGSEFPPREAPTWGIPSPDEIGVEPVPGWGPLRAAPAHPPRPYAIGRAR